MSEQERTAAAPPPDEVVEDSTATATATAPPKAQKNRPKPKKQPPRAVIVHNDEFHTWPYVIDVLRRVCGHPMTTALKLTSDIHHSGRAVVWTGTLEVAELKRDQIRGFGTDFYASNPVRFPLGVTIETMPGD